jgi:hypothetical protein
MKNTALRPVDNTAQAALHPRLRRPFSVSLLLLGVLIITGGSLVRLILSIRQREFLAGFSGVSPVYMAASGLVWTLVFLPLSWGLFFNCMWAPRFTRLAVAAYVGATWLERSVLLLRQALISGSAFSLPASASNLVFQLVGSIVLLFFVYWSLSRKNVKAYFGVNHE